MKTGFMIVKYHDGLKFSGSILESDLIKLDLFPLDRALMDTTDFDSPPEDQLLVLEMLFRRMNEQLMKEQNNG